MATVWTVDFCKYLTLLLQKTCLENATTDLREGTDHFTEAPIIANDIAQWNFRANLGLRVSEPRLSLTFSLSACLFQQTQAKLQNYAPRVTAETETFSKEFIIKCYYTVKCQKY